MTAVSDRTDTDRPPRTTPRRTRRSTNGGDPPMQLTDLLDLQDPDVIDGEGIPCRENDSELWFAESPEDLELSKALCGDCPVRALCLDGALARREPWGVWGGELFLDGVVIPRKRPRGRPRKDQRAA